jgi:hypothetical protein
MKLEYDDNINRWTWDMWRQGLEMVSENRVAIVVSPFQELIGNDMTEESLTSSLQYQMRQVCLIQELANVRMTLFILYFASRMNKETIFIYASMLS